MLLYTTCCRPAHWFSLGLPKPDGDCHSASKNHGMIELSHSHPRWKLVDVAFGDDDDEDDEDDEEK